MRVKEVTVEGSKFKISSLSVDQVTALVFTQDETEGTNGQLTATAKGTRNFVKDRACPIVAASLNNAIMGDAEWFSKHGFEDKRSDMPSGAPVSAIKPVWWTGDSIAAKLDWAEVIGLHSEISRFTGLMAAVTTEKAGGKDSQGEAPAATIAIQ